MANVSFKKGLLANLPTSYSEGTFYVTTDERAIYLDVSSTARVRLGDFQEFASLTALEANANPSTSALYYITELNILAKWDGSKYVQINRDTGATSITVTGTGNAVTVATYDEANRKITLTKGATYATPAEVDNKISAKVGTLSYNSKTYDTVKDYVDAKTSGIATDAALGDLTTRVTNVEDAVDVLQGDKNTDGSVAKAIDDAISALDVNAVTAGTGEVISAVSETDGKVSVSKKTLAAADIPSVSHSKISDWDTELNKKQNTLTFDGTYNSSTNKVATKSTVTSAIGALDVTDTAVDGKYVSAVSETDGKITVTRASLPTAPVYSIIKAEDSGDYAAIYNLTKDGTAVGAAINIPKDMVVKEGSVVTNPAGQTAGTYIKLVLQNNEDNPLYINVGSLIEYVTSGSASSDMVVVSVNDDHKVTATITDGTVTLAKLASAVQTKINQAHTHSNKTVLDGITSTKVSAWDAAEKNAKDYADGLADNYDAAGAANTALSSAKTYADGLAKNYDAAGAASTALTNAKSYADGLAKNYDAAGAANTALSSAKTYADQAETDAIASAKTYTDTCLTWGSF